MSLPVRVKVEGHPYPELVASTGICRCGTIHNGVAFHFAQEKPFKSEGSWVIAFADLERIYEAAKAQRQPEDQGDKHAD